jgi:endonuclease G
MKKLPLLICVVAVVLVTVILLTCGTPSPRRTEHHGSPEQEVAIPSAASAPAYEDAPWGLPVGSPSVRVLSRVAFTIGHDGVKRQPRWVAYHIKSEYVGLPALGKRKFVPDPELPEEESAKKSDYENSGYDRGHMAPFASVRRKDDPRPEDESCYFSNICPQKPSLNRQIWSLLEERVRDWAKKYGEVWVVTGPIFGEDGKTLPSGRVAIPLSFYKIVARVDGEKIELLSFILSQDATSTAEDKKFTKFLVSVDEVEKATGLDFMSELPDEVENVLEAKKPAEIWQSR